MGLAANRAVTDDLRQRQRRERPPRLSKAGAGAAQADSCQGSADAIALGRGSPRRLECHPRRFGSRRRPLLTSLSEQTVRPARDRRGLHEPTHGFAGAASVPLRVAVLV